MAGSAIPARIDPGHAGERPGVSETAGESAMGNSERISVPVLCGGEQQVPHLASLLQQVCRECPDKDAVVFPDCRLTYRELFARGVARSASFRALGLKRGAHIGVWGGTSPELVEVLIGASMAGLVTVLLSARYRPDEIAYVIADSDIEVLFTFAPTPFSDFPRMLSVAFPNMQKEGGRLHSSSAPRLRSVYVIGDPAPHDLQSYGAFVELASTGQEREVIDNLPKLSVQDNFVMLYTSGTTAKPKGVLLTYVNVIGKALSFPQLYRMDASSRFWDPLPFFHIGFVWPMTGCFVAGATLLAMRHFDPDSALEMLAKERATHAYPGFQALWQPVITHGSFRSRDLSSLKVILHVGARDILERAQRATPHASVISAYGLTESTGTYVHADPDEPEEVRLGTEGRALPGCEVRIVKLEDGRPCEPDEMGEVQLRGYCVASSYYRDPDRTSECFLPEGWFRTGDLGSIDASGRMSFRGRLKDMLKVGGENVAALEIEQALCRHPAVSCAQVIGIPDEKYEEVAAAFVELIPGESATGEELIEFCAAKISRFKLPRFVTFMTAWPMSATKIQKHRLKELPLGPRLIP